MPVAPKLNQAELQAVLDTFSFDKVVEYRLWPILDALGIPRCGLHAFRHTHTALLLDSGATQK